jgi:hypothetical protein
VTISQRGSTYPIYLDLQQTGTVLTGKAQYTTNRGDVHLNGTVDGTIGGNTFSIQIFWPGGLTGVYNAKVLPSGRLDGETHDKNKSTVQQTWNSQEVLKCIPTAGGQGLFGTPVFPIKPGKTPVKKSEPAPPPKPPYITAGQVIAQPYVPFSSVYLGWDGGADHPHVEVFVSMDNGADIPAFSINYAPQHPIFKQPKIAAAEMKLSKGHFYRFVLKDGGTTLARVEFAVP